MARWRIDVRGDGLAVGVELELFWDGGAGDYLSPGDHAYFVRMSTNDRSPGDIESRDAASAITKLEDGARWRIEQIKISDPSSDDRSLWIVRDKL